MGRFASRLFWPAVLILVTLPHIWIQFATSGIIGGDGYYHIRHADLLRLAGPTLSIPFPWLPTTILNQAEFSNHHLLYHLLLMPFTFGDLILGAKIATILFASLAILTWFLISKAQGVKWPLFCLIALLASSSDFLYRLSMTRRQSLVLILLLLAVHLILKRNLKWLVVLGFAFSWLYDGWILLIAVVLLTSLGRFIENRKIDWLSLFSPIGGLILGTIINPFFPNNFIFSIRHLLPKLTLPANYIVKVGTEWYPYTLDMLIKNAGFSLVLVAVSLFITTWLILKGKKVLNARLIAWGGCTLLFTAMLLSSNRFVEYQPAFATMFAAISFTALVKTDRFQLFLKLPKKLIYPFIVLISTVFLLIAIYNAHSAYYVASFEAPPQKFDEASKWLVNSSNPQERIFTSSWDYFPRLFFYNTKNTYLSGLDPTYMYQFDPHLYNRWQEIRQGNVANPSFEILNLFNSRFVLIDIRAREFLEQAQKDPNMEIVYKDKWATIFKIY